MAAIAKFREDKGAWYVFINENKIRKSYRAKDEKSARKLAAIHNAERQKAKAVAPELVGSKAFDEVAQRWFDARSGEWTDTTRKKARSDVKRLIALLSNRDIRTIDRKTVGSIAETLAAKHARSTAVGTVGQIATILNWALEEKLIRELPCKGIRGVGKRIAEARCGPVTTADAWTHDEMKALLATCAKKGDWIYDPVFFAFRTGCRIGELVALEWKDVDLKRERVTFRQSKPLHQLRATKNARNRTCGLAPDILEHLRSMHDRRGKAPHVFLHSRGEPWFAPSLSSVWRKVRAECPDARDLKFHCLRHTWATWALDDGWSNIAAAQFIGDTLDVFNKHYAHVLGGKQFDLSLGFQLASAPAKPARPRRAARRRRPLELVK
jgi:integrase